MPTSATRIDEPPIERDSRGKITAVRFAFGPHHCVEVWVGSATGGLPASV